MSRDVADLLADLDRLDGPDLWAQITDRVTSFELVGDPEPEDSDEVLG